MDKELAFTEFLHEPGAVLPALPLVGRLPGLVHKSVYIPCKQLHSWYSRCRMKIIKENDTSEHIKRVFWWESSFIYEREWKRERGRDVCVDSFLCVPGRAWEQGHGCFVFVLPPWSMQRWVPGLLWVFTRLPKVDSTGGPVLIFFTTSGFLSLGSEGYCWYSVLAAGLSIWLTIRGNLER